MKFTIKTPVNNLKESIDFYKKLNFKSVTETIVTDGIACIELSNDSFVRPSLVGYLNNDFTIIEKLQKITTVIEKEDFYLLSIPSGTWIYLNKKDIKLPKKEAQSFSVLGNFSGISIETIAIEKEKEIFELFGFTQNMGDISQGWISLKNNDGFIVSLMAPSLCPHIFINPSLTYFNGKENNPKIIKKIRDLEIDIEQEITHFSKNNTVDNIILRDKGGLGFFIFND